MRRPRLAPLLAAVALLVVTSWLARRSLERCQRFLVAINRHDVALARSEPPLAAAPPGPSHRVVLVIVDGLGHWASQGLPTLGYLRSRGVDAVALSHAPSLSRPNYTSILTGVPPVHSGVRTNEYRGEVALDSLGRRAREAGLSSVFVTDVASSIATMYPGAFSEVVYANWSGGFPDASALALTRDYRLVVLLPGAVDDCAHERRMSSAACDRATRDVDRYLGAVVAQLDLSRDTLIVTADHGHVHSGGHGGGERAVMEVPLVMAGAGIVAGTPFDAAHRPRLIDLAPTIAALLGIPAPRHGLGSPLLDALDLPPATRAILAAGAAARVNRNHAVVAAEQAAGRAEQAAGRPHAILAIVIAIGGLAGVLVGLARLQVWRLDRRSVLVGVTAPAVAIAAMFVDSDCLGSLSGFSSRHEWTERALLSIVVTAGFLMVGTMARRYRDADERLTAGNGVMAVALATGGAWELTMSFLFERDPFVVLPGETVLFLLVATPVVLVALFLALAAWRVVELIAFVARLHGPIPVVAAAAVAGLSACAGPASPKPTPPPPPRVVVLVVVDQTPGVVVRREGAARHPRVRRAPPARRTPGGPHPVRRHRDRTRPRRVVDGGAAGGDRHHRQRVVGPRVGARGQGGRGSGRARLVGAAVARRGDRRRVAAAAPGRPRHRRVVEGSQRAPGGGADRGRGLVRRPVSVPGVERPAPVALAARPRRSARLRRPPRDHVDAA